MCIRDSNKDAFYGVTREQLMELLSAEGIGCLASGYSQPITDMEILHDDTFQKVTGSNRTYKEVDIDVYKRQAVGGGRKHSL